MEFIPSTGHHLHIVLNHVPVIGTLVAVLLLAIALYANSADLKRISLIGFSILALLVIPTYLSGGAARWTLEANERIAAPLVAAHHDAASWAFVLSGATGLVAWLILWRARRSNDEIGGWPVWSVLVLSFVTLAAMVRTGSLGGYIHRPELLTPEELTRFSGGFGRSSIELFNDRLYWAWPAAEAAHFIGLALIFGPIVVIGLRVFGYSKNLSFAAVHRLLPLAVFGLLVNVVTGMYFFITDSGRYVAMAGFPIKIALLMLAGFSVLYLTIAEAPWRLEAGAQAGTGVKLVAGAAIVLWAGVIVFGRLLPYYGGGG